ncbi:MBL fold metallo-hydrolase [Baekduia soli]|uniref:MBL fold metallo-hydrolase n=1 Tax=Baekduia soli TaxID=496014 RepID=A0A5B8U5N1_9ACTN|nr:MBL fold metallo-hydrolase [Baekduia soli]QEC48148.1 MBL fold metallo-hydrolase [Baekduia soli]
MSIHREIDIQFQGTPRTVCTHWIDGYVVDPGPESSVATLMAELGDEQPKAVLLTHIHLDHAGAAGALVERWPDLEVWVHRNGAPHVIDPSRLVASATRLYGDRMEELWGRIIPVAESNVRVLEDEGAAAGLRWAFTPGHASHHVSYLHEASGIAFAGDVAGVRIGDGPILPPTPPPDIDLEAWERSIALLRSWSPSAVAIAHFGTYTDVDRHLDVLGEELRRLADLARVSDDAAFQEAVHATYAGGAEEAAYQKAMPLDTLFGGLARYWKKRDTAGQT